MNFDRHRSMSVGEFFERLTWDRFKDKLVETLKNPHASVPQQIQCPAVMDLFREIAQSVGETAIQKPGEPLTLENIFNLDQRLALLRILEALVRIAEEGPLSSTSLRSLGEPGFPKGIPASPLKEAADKARSLKELEG